MRIGPIEIKRFSDKSISKPQRVELGATGTIILSGQLCETEYNPDLRGSKGLVTYDKMRLSDGQVKGTLMACTLPIRVANWDIAAASNDPIDKEIAAYVRDNFFDQMTITWDDFLRQALLMCSFGFSPFEKVWELIDGMYRYRKFAPRLPKTITKWKIDKEGGLAGIEQVVYKDDVYQFISIPVEKLLLFTLDREGSNFAGVSVLRAAYKHWYYKDVLYRIDGIAAERHGVGISVFTLPSTASTEGPDSDQSKIDKIGSTLHTHERSYISLPEGYSFDLKGVTGQLHETMKSVDHHDMQIARSILLQFMNLGAQGVGSYAQSVDQSAFFLMALQAVGKNISDTINHYAIPQLVDYNWDTKKYPKIVMSGLERRDIASYSRAVADLVYAGALKTDSGIEDELRSMLKFPPRTAPQLEEKRIPPERTPPERMKFEEPQEIRHPRGFETFVAFDDMEKKLDTAEMKFVSAIREIRKDQVKQIVDMVIKDIESGQFSKIISIPVPMLARMDAAIENILLDLYTFGQKQVAQELSKQRKSIRAQEIEAKVISITPRELIKVRARTTTSVLASKLRSAMSYEVLRQLGAGDINRGELETALISLSDADLVATAKFSVSEALNLGRSEEAKANGDEIEKVIYSALMDRGTCGPCGEIDGKEFDYPSAEWDEVEPPYKECEGQTRCRCVGIFVLKTELTGG